MPFSPQTVEVGFRTDEGILESRFEFTTASIPAIVASAPDCKWSASPCLHFMHATLALLMRNVLTEADPPPRSDGLPQPTMYKLVFTPRRGVELHRIDPVSFGPGRWAFLPESYVRWRLHRS